MAKELSICNLHETIDEDTLRQHLEIYGNIVNIYLMTDDDGSFNNKI